MSESALLLPGPLDRLSTMPTGIPTITLGWEAMRWAVKYLRQPNGPHAGDRFEFTLGQARYVLWWYALDESGRWLYHGGARRLAKGSGKSPFAAALSLIELCAPVRLARFDPTVPGGCVGKRVSMPLVQIAATAQSQTENTMRMVRAFAPKGSRVVKDHGLDPGVLSYNAEGGGRLHVLTSSSAAAEGGEATFIVGDEPEHWTTRNGGHLFHATLSDNLAKSGSRMLETANAWVPGAGSVAESTWDQWVAQESGLQPAESRILYDAVIAPPTAVHHDHPELGQVGLTDALRFVYADCPWQLDNLDALKSRIWDSRTTADVVNRKYFNRPTVEVNAWTTPERWSALRLPREVKPREEVVLFFDGSKSRDATAVMGCCMSDGYVFTVGVWQPDPTHDTNSVVPFDEVDAAVSAAMGHYTVLAFFADVHEWEGFTKVTWPGRWADTLLVHASPSGREPAAIAWDMRSHSYLFAEAAELCLAEIEGGEFRHDGSTIVAQHVANARTMPIKDRVSLRKETPNSPKKIDAAICVVGARMVRRIVLASKEWEQRNKQPQTYAARRIR